MDCVSPILDVASRLWDCTSNRAVYIRELPQNLESLTDAMKQLKDVYADVKERVEREEKLQKKRTHAVDGWILSVEAMEKEVDGLLAKGRVEIQKKCLGTCCPKNCRASYKMGKMVRAKMEDVASKRTEGQSFSVVAEPLPSPAVIERPLDEMVGVDSFFNHVCMQLQDEKISRVGLYGMGGIGKTTLLNRINNEFLKTRVELDVVIWVTVSRPANVEKVQRVIFNKLGISSEWEGRSEDERKEEIFNVLKTKKFVLLLDDIWEPLDPLAVGIPPLHDGCNSKVVLTTRFLSVCRDMGAKAIEVKRLEWADALTLFHKYVGEDTINSHPYIPKLAEIAAKECDGLPLALTVIGRAMVGAKTPEEWEKKIQMLKKYPEKFPGMEKHLFSRLAFSYDSLLDEATKSCFLYCSLFPEDFEILCDQLIQLWIGEGFLDEYSDIKEARNGGEEIIASLIHACLLEETTNFIPNFYFQYGRCVKMHDVIRDMTLWLACQDENKEKLDKFVVVDKNKVVTTQEVEKWKGARRISLFCIGFEEDMKPPSFANLQTLLLHSFLSEKLFSIPFPNGFFTYMPNIKVLDFTKLCNLKDLPWEIGNLSSLQYLNLSGTSIKKIPEGLGNLKRLRCLIMDEMSDLCNSQPGIISCLSSLKLFSCLSSLYNYQDCIALIEELEGLKCIEEVSFLLHGVVSLETLLNSHKLRGCLKFLHVGHCKRVNRLRLSFPHPEKLEINNCSRLEEVLIHLEKEVGAQSTLLSPRHQPSLSQLSHVKIMNCESLKKLTCLTHAPNLKFLYIRDCGSLEELVQEEECGISETKSDQWDVFMRLRYLYLIGLGDLRSISRGKLCFPSLQVIQVVKCPNLRRLPFDSNITRSSMHLETISGKLAWWEELEWEDHTIMHHLTPYFKHY